MNMNILKQIGILYEQELYSNVTSLAELAISLFDQKQEQTPYMKFQIYIYHADALYNLQQYVHAEINYAQALQVRKYIIKTKNSTKIPDTQKEILSDVDIKYKIYLCCVKLKLNQKAIEILQSIAARARTPKINMALGNLYRDAGYERSATTCFKEVLREYPFAVEAAENLLKLGVKGIEVNSLMLEATTDLGWVSNWLRGQAQMHSRDYSNAIATFKSIESLKDNSRLIVTIAYCYIYMCDEKRALLALQRALHVDPKLITGRDLLSNLLANSPDKEHARELERLVNPDLDMALWCSEHWVVMGWYMFTLKRYERSAYFGQQACSLNRRNVDALLLKANTFMQICKYHDAMLHFREVIQYSPYRFEAHKGIVEANNRLSRVREALAMSSNACKLLNNSPQALVLYASTLMKETPVQSCKVRGLLDRALTTDITYTPAICLLAEHLDNEQRYEDACTLLQRHVDKHPSSRTHQLLADCLARIQKDDEAFSHYSAALRLDPHNQRAMEGLNGLGRSPTKLDSSYYMSVTGESSSYASQGPSVPSDELEESDSDPWPNTDFMSYE